MTALPNKQALQWTLQVHRERPKNNWKRLGEICVDNGFQVQMEEDGDKTKLDGWPDVVCCPCYTDSNMT